MIKFVETDTSATLRAQEKQLSLKKQDREAEPESCAPSDNEKKSVINHAATLVEDPGVINHAADNKQGSGSIYRTHKSGAINPAPTMVERIEKLEAVIDEILKDIRKASDRGLSNPEDLKHEFQTAIQIFARNGDRKPLDAFLKKTGGRAPKSNT